MNKKEFDYQWKNLPSPSTEYNEDRIKELLEFTKINRGFFKDKLCLDAGCGNGRYTYALLELGAIVDSIDISPEAINLCINVNPSSYLQDIMNLEVEPKYDFILCWGVLHHLANPEKGFKILSSQLKEGGILHIMVYNRKTQKVYEEGRRKWHYLNIEERINYCRYMIKKYGGNIHGWYDAFNPKFNWSYSPRDIKKWFKNEGFRNIRLITKLNINMNGVK